MEVTTHVRATERVPPDDPRDCSSSSAITSARCASPTVTASCRTWPRSCGVDHIALSVSLPDGRRRRHNPLFSIDHNRCILCTRCVRGLRRRSRARSRGTVMGRGVDERVVTDMGTAVGRVRHARVAASASGLSDRGALYGKRAIDRRGAKQTNWRPYLTLDAGARRDEPDVKWRRFGSTAVQAATCPFSTRTSG